MPTSPRCSGRTRARYALVARRVEAKLLGALPCLRVRGLSANGGASNAYGKRPKLHPLARGLLLLAVLLLGLSVAAFLCVGVLSGLSAVRSAVSTSPATTAPGPSLMGQAGTVVVTTPSGLVDGGLEADERENEEIIHRLRPSWVLKLERKVGLAAPTSTQDIMGKRIELSLVVVVTNDLLPNLREFVGWTHKHCPRCSIEVYNHGVAPKGLREIHSWERVDVHDVYKVLTTSRPNFLLPVHLPTAAIYHSLFKLHRRRAIYVDVRYRFSRNLLPMDRMLHSNGMLLAVDSSHLAAVENEWPSVLLNGYSREDKTSADFLKELLSADACKADKSTACVFQRHLWLPVSLVSDLKTAKKWALPSMLKLGVVPQNLAQSVVRMSVPAEANANTDIENIAAERKAYHTELEMYAKTHVAYVRFDLTEITGDVLSAELKLQTVWLAEAGKRPTAHPAKFRVSRVDDNDWEEKRVPWASRPLRTYDHVVGSATYGSASLVDVTEMVKSTVLRQRASQDEARSLISFELSTDEALWLKFASRRATNGVPLLLVKIKGQGVGYRHIHTQIHLHNDALV